MIFTPDEIIKLKENEVFVFGSNVQGEHVGGAALAALKNFGAENGKGIGLQGQSYAIPTCVRVWRFNDRNGQPIYKTTLPFDNVGQIKPFINVFISDVKTLTNKVFYVTKIGCGIAGFKIAEIAELFRPCLDMPNVVLPKEFVECLLYTEVINNLKERGLRGGVDYDDDVVMKFVMDRIEAHSLDDILDEFENIKA